MMEDIEYKELSMEEISTLEEAGTFEKIKKVVWESDGKKFPGPNEINFGCFKRCWNVLEDDLVKFIFQFHKNVKLPKAINAFFLALVQNNC